MNKPYSSDPEQRENFSTINADFFATDSSEKIDNDCPEIL
jgi:hypothetical protein